MNLTDLTLAEVEIVERKAGTAITALSDPERPKAVLFATLAWVIKKREDPAFTYEQAQALSMAEATALIGDMTDVDPTGSEPPSDSPSSA